MHLLDLLTILCAGLMIGNELAVSLFLNPAVWQLDERPQTKVLSLLARSLGSVMPFWYALCLLLLLVEAYIRRGGPTFHLLLAAIVIWAAVIAWTILVLVPINKRIASLSPASLPAQWRHDHKKWDKLHRWRILFLIVAMLLLTYGLLSAGVPAQLASVG
jgi:uncharacterized membrane protein